MKAFKKEHIKELKSGSILYRARKIKLESLMYASPFEEDYKEEDYKEEYEFWNNYCETYFLNGKELVIESLKQPYNIVSIANSYAYVNINKKIAEAFKNDFLGYNKQNSSAPPKEKCTAYRFNKKFEPVLYLAEDIDTCLVECGANYDELFSIGEFKNTNDIKIYDFTLSDGDFNALWLSCIASQTNNSSTVYLKTQVLAECVKRLGCDGLKFNSSKYPSGYCYAIFDPDNFDCFKSYITMIDSIKITHKL